MVWPGSRHLNVWNPGVFSIPKTSQNGRCVSNALLGSDNSFCFKMRKRNIGLGTLVDLDRNGLLVVMLWQGTILRHSIMEDRKTLT